MKRFLSVTPLRNVIFLSMLLITPLPALGQPPVPSVTNRAEPLLVADIFDMIRLGRQILGPRRPARVAPSVPLKSGSSDRQRTSIQRPSDSSTNNRQPRQPQSVAPVNEQEQLYLNSLSPEERQVYEIIEKAKKDLQQQPMANFLGSVAGMTPKEISQSPADLDREFQAAIRKSSSESNVKPTVTTGGVASDKKSGNRLLQRILNKRSNETHEQWYARIDPIISRTPGEEYRAWKSTLSPLDNKAYDALVSKENQARREQFSESMSDMIRYQLSCRRVDKPDGEYGETVEVCGD
jgi:hypothetical protein